MTTKKDKIPDVFAHIDDLTAQISNMRCCGNCKHYIYTTDWWCAKTMEKADGRGFCRKWELV